jgi:3-hydroxyacyl-CoA dehydrogenase
VHDSDFSLATAAGIRKHGTMPLVTLARRGLVAVITIDNPPVHALATEVRAGLIAAIAELNADPALTAGVIATSGRTFIAGADLREMDRPLEEPQLPDVIRAVAGSPKPLVAALYGSVLGGGLEIALACRARIAARATVLGFPEVKIGLVPGAGGTQRLLRMTDFASAVRLVTTGRPIPAEEALRLGLIHAVTDSDQLEAALSLAASPALADQAIYPSSAAIEARPAARPAAETADTLKADVLKAARGQGAPPAAFDLLLQTSKLAFAHGVEEERAVFVLLRSSREAKALRRLFLAEREAGRLPDLKDIPVRSLESVGVVGAGLMGCGIGFAALSAGCRVTMAEGSDDALDRGRVRMAELMDAAAKAGRLPPVTRMKLESALVWTTDFAAFAHCDLVIEAVFEDMAVKHEVFRRLEAVVRPDALLASNTSYLDLDAIAEPLEFPGRFLGLHFFSPAHVMRLMEVVRGARTAPETLASGVGFGRRLGKIPVVTAVCEGFCGNRILKAYRIVAETMVEDGAAPAEVDAAMTEFGFPMGPFAVQDMAGLEIAYANRRLKPALRADGRRLGLVEMMVEAGRLGRKNGKGWYAYGEGDRTGAPDPAVNALIETYRVTHEIPHRAFSHAVIRDALLAAMTAEGEAILKEGIVARPEDIDLVMVNGYGFPAHKGGPMFRD